MVPTTTTTPVPCGVEPDKFHHGAGRECRLEEGTEDCFPNDDENSAAGLEMDVDR